MNDDSWFHIYSTAFICKGNSTAAQVRKLHIDQTLANVIACIVFFYIILSSSLFLLFFFLIFFFQMLPLGAALQKLPSLYLCTLFEVFLFSSCLIAPFFNVLSTPISTIPPLHVSKPSQPFLSLYSTWAVPLTYLFLFLSLLVTPD